MRRDFLRRAALLFLIMVPAGNSGAQEAPLPAPLEKLFARGVAQLKAGDLDAAERTFAQALRRPGGRRALAYHNLGVIRQRRGDHQQAVAHFRQATKLQPDYGPSWLLAGSSSLTLGNYPDAVRELERAARLLPPDTAEVQQQLARAYEATGDWPSAVEVLERLARAAPQDAKRAYQLGRAYTKLSEWSLQKIIRLDANAARLHQSLGYELLTQGKYALAIDAYQRAAQADPRLPEIHLALALIHLELKNFGAALDEIETEIKLAPESVQARDAKKKIEAARQQAP